MRQFTIVLKQAWESAEWKQEHGALVFWTIFLSFIIGYVIVKVFFVPYPSDSILDRAVLLVFWGGSYLVLLYMMWFYPSP